MLNKTQWNNYFFQTKKKPLQTIHILKNKFNQFVDDFIKLSIAWFEVVHYYSEPEGMVLRLSWVV